MCYLFGGPSAMLLAAAMLSMDEAAHSLKLARHWLWWPRHICWVCGQYREQMSGTQNWELFNLCVV